VTIKRNKVIPWGRSFEEYRRMFALADEDLAGRILGCGDDRPEAPPAPTRSEAAR
jgi:hypothetical protein